MNLSHRGLLAIVLCIFFQLAGASFLPAQSQQLSITATTAPSVASHVVFSSPGRLDIKPGSDVSVRNARSATRELAPADGAFFFSQAMNFQMQLGYVEPSSIAVADVDGDGNLDVVVEGQDQSNGKGSVSVFFGNGDGTLQSPVNYDTGGAGADSVFVIDVNGDGLPDIVVANQSGGNGSNGSVSVLLNGLNSNPPGTFQLAATYDSGGVSASSVFVVDVNGDGLPDIVVANQGPTNKDGSVGVLLNNADGVPGSFSPAVTYDSDGNNATAVTLADLNGDGYPDIVVANYCFAVNNCPQQQGGVTVYFNNADGTGNFTLSGTSVTPGPTVSVAVGDVNDDGIPDIIVACETEGVAYFPGQGGGSIGSYQSLGVAGQVLSVTVQDVNGDGIPDVLAGLGYCLQCDQGNDSGVTVLLGTGAGNFNAPLTYDTGGQQVESIGLGVMNLQGTGNPDLVVPNTCDSGNIDDLCFGNVAVLLNSTNELQTTLASSLNPAIIAQKVTYTATVSNGDGATPTGNVVFRDGQTVLGTVALTSGRSSFTASYSVGGLHSITAQYVLNQLSQISSIVTEDILFASTTKVTSSLPVSNLGQAVTFTSTAISKHGPIPDNETVTFYNGTAQIGTGTTASGVASFTTSSLPAGKLTIKALYAGDATFASSSGTVKQTVSPYVTTTTLTSNINPSNYGQAVLLTAQVTSGGTPTGTVTFYNGTLKLGTGTLSNGTATLSITTLPVGTDSLTAVYKGDADDSGSTSQPLSQTVNQAQINFQSLVSSRNPATVNVAVTFTGTLSSNGGLPAGQIVTFTVNGSTLGTAVISKTGIAKLSTKFSAEGSYQVTASFAGNADYSWAASAPLTENVN